jgi:hypothetical protein
VGDGPGRQGFDPRAVGPDRVEEPDGDPGEFDADERFADVVHTLAGAYGWGIEVIGFGVPWTLARSLQRRIAEDREHEQRLRAAQMGIEGPEPGFAPSNVEGLPDRFEEDAASPAWRRALELNARRRQN